MGPKEGWGRGTRPGGAGPPLTGIPLCSPGEAGILAPSPEQTAEVSRQTLERKGLGGREGRGWLCFRGKLGSLSSRIPAYGIVHEWGQHPKRHTPQDTGVLRLGRARKIKTYSSHSEKRNGRGSCLVSEWSPVAWEQELSLRESQGRTGETSPQ